MAAFDARTRLTTQQKRTLEGGPSPPVPDARDFGYAATTWTAPLLQKHLAKQCQIEVSVSWIIYRLQWQWSRPRFRFALRPVTSQQPKGSLTGPNARILTTPLMPDETIVAETSPLYVRIWTGRMASRNAHRRQLE